MKLVNYLGTQNFIDSSDSMGGARGASIRFVELSDENAQYAWCDITDQGPAD